MRIFLSHASESKALVVRLTEPLPPHVQIWLDRDALAAGQRFGPRIEAAIRRDCDFVLVFIDEHALASDWVKRETALALQRQADLQRTFVLPVLLRPLGARINELGIDPEQMLYLDATDGSDAGVALGTAGDLRSIELPAEVPVSAALVLDLGPDVSWLE